MNPPAKRSRPVEQRGSAGKSLFPETVLGRLSNLSIYGKVQFTHVMQLLQLAVGQFKVPQHSVSYVRQAARRLAPPRATSSVDESRLRSVVLNSTSFLRFFFTSISSSLQFNSNLRIPLQENSVSFRSKPWAAHSGRGRALTGPPDLVGLSWHSPCGELTSREPMLDSSNSRSHLLRFTVFAHA